MISIQSKKALKENKEKALVSRYWWAESHHLELWDLKVKTLQEIILDAVVDIMGCLGKDYQILEKLNYKDSKMDSKSKVMGSKMKVCSNLKRIKVYTILIRRYYKTVNQNLGEIALIKVKTPMCIILKIEIWIKIKL